MLAISGLKCDYCDYRDDTVPYSDYPTSIGKPCPKCGESLLTQQEFDDCEKILRRVANIEKTMRYFRWLNPFFYWRLIFGDNRNEYKLTVKFPNRKTN
jgi:hypothetical protein